MLILLFILIFTYSFTHLSVYPSKPFLRPSYLLGFMQVLTKNEQDKIPDLNIVPSSINRNLAENIIKIKNQDRYQILLKIKPKDMLQAACVHCFSILMLPDIIAITDKCQRGECYFWRRVFVFFILLQKQITNTYTYVTERTQANISIQGQELACF